MTPGNRLGAALMVGTVFCYTVQDGLTRHLAGEYNVLMVVMVRYWFFAAFVLLLAARRPGGLAAALRSVQAPLHLARAVLHSGEICVLVLSFTLVGLIGTHAVFAVCPLIVAALSGPLLGERVGLARWLAIGAGFLGVLVVLRPGSELFTPLALLPLASALMFALYSVLTRRAMRREPAFAAFFWSGLLGAVLMTLAGVWSWQPMGARDWALTLANGAVALASNWMMIRAYEVAEASAVQPFAYLQLVFVAVMGVLVFGEVLEPAVMLGAAVVAGAGLFALVAPEGRRRGVARQA